jgi:hypothetical protein
MNHEKLFDTIVWKVNYLCASGPDPKLKVSEQKMLKSKFERI